MADPPMESPFHPLHALVLKMKFFDIAFHIFFLQADVLHSVYLYNNLAKPFTTVGADPFYAQTSGLDTPKFLQADPKFSKNKINKIVAISEYN
jgi:hypothetical protein